MQSNEKKKNISVLFIFRNNNTYTCTNTHPDFPEKENERNMFTCLQKYYLNCVLFKLINQNNNNIFNIDPQIVAIL